MKDLRTLLRHALGSNRPTRLVSKIVFGTESRKSTIQNYRERAWGLGLTWEQLKDKSMPELRKLFHRPGNRGRLDAAPDFADIERALEHPGMTLQTYWQERREAFPDRTLSYSRLAALWREHAKRRKRVMRNRLVPGEQVFVDYSGKRPWYYDEAGEQVFVELFVAALGRSGKVFAWCSRSQSIPDWVDAHVRMYAFYGGVPPITVSDNLKSAVTRAGRDPEIQRTYLELGEHYGTAILPARPYRPRDKAKAEGSVLLMQRAFLPMLRHHRCGSLDELNALLARRVDEVNRKGFTKRADNREVVFHRMDAPALQPLPRNPFQYVRWTSVRVVPHDYHIRVDGHWYSCPESWVGHEVEACTRDGSVFIHREGFDPVRHALNTERDGQTTDPHHMSAAHRAQLHRTPDDLKAWAARVGPNTAAFVQRQFEGKVPLQGFPKAEQARSLARQHGEAAVEAAAGRALAMNVATPSGLKRLLSSLPKDNGPGPASFVGAPPAALPVQPARTRHPKRRTRRQEAAAPVSDPARVEALPVHPIISSGRQRGARKAGAA